MRVVTDTDIASIGWKRTRRRLLFVTSDSKEECRLEAKDYFMSHSWHGKDDAKPAVLQDIVRDFQRNHGSDSTFGPTKFASTR